VDFSLDRRHENGVEIIGLRGHLVAETADLLSACVDTTLPRSRRVIIDMTHTSLLDQDGFAALLRGEHLARQRHGWLRVAGVHGAVQEVFTTFDGWARLGGNATLEMEIERATAQQAAEAYFDLGRAR